MPFRVSDDTWLKVEANRVQSIICVPKFWRRAWTPESLKEALDEIGLHYSMPEILAINDELHRRDVVTDVGP